jgi:ABC-2 type transport system ATP-binding protein
MIVTKDLNKSFGSVKAVRGLNISIPPGEIYGLVGSDGAGKTTTLRLLVGALKPDSGTVTISGYSLDSQVEQARAQIGYLSQRFSLYEDLTVLENIRFFAEVRGLSTEKWLPRSMEILDFVGLAVYKDRKAGLLSGGMKQKLGLASALVSQPLVLLLDEPTTGVDPVTRQDFWQLLVKLVSQSSLPTSQVAVVITTPYMDEAARCNRLGFMLQGRIIAEGTPSQLRGRLEKRILEVRGHPLRELSVLVKDQPGVDDVRLFGDRLHIRTTTKDTQEFMKNLEMKVSEIEGKLDSIREISPNLEDVFIFLSEKRVASEKAVLELPDAHTRALRFLLDRVPPDLYGWVLTGSANLRLQGVDLDIHDLDIQGSPEDIRKIEKELKNYVANPIHTWGTDRIRSLDGKCNIENVEIELIADLEIQGRDGSWQALKKLEPKTWLEWQGLEVPVFPLEREAAYYTVLGRDEKARLISETIRRKKEKGND